MYTDSINEPRKVCLLGQNVKAYLPLFVVYTNYLSLCNFINPFSLPSVILHNRLMPGKYNTATTITHKLPFQSYH